MAKYIQVVTTVPSREESEKIALELVKQHLAGCVQILGPITSFYWWQGKIEQSQEWLCVAKTERKLFAQIEEIIKRLHSYEVPEILAIPVVAGSESYLKWLQEQLQ